MLPCLACQVEGIKQTTKTQAHHIKDGFLRIGMSGKAGDDMTIPLCAIHHVDGGRMVAFHSSPRKGWEQRYGKQLELLEKTREMLMVTP